VIQRRIEKLTRVHAVEDFDCGKEPLNRFLQRYALQNQQAAASQTYVGLVDNELIGYYTLAFGAVEHEEAPARVRKGLARYPIPLMVLARLAVSSDWQRRGVGAALLKDAVLRTLQAAEIAGLRALAVHAKDDDARAFYERYGFIAAPTDPYHLLVLLRDIKTDLGIV
jgi:GNAT superfamily N-acetyltransferase